MLVAWCLILSVTCVSVTMLMIIGTYLAVLPQAQQYFATSQTMVLLLSNSFNIFYILLSPLLFRSFNRHYFGYVAVSTAAAGVGAIGRYLAGQNYGVALAMTSVVAIAHIPIITAPYGLLKLFPDHQKGYAASIPLFLPVLGLNFCILYGMSYITGGEGETVPTAEVHSRISDLNYIIALVGSASAIFTLALLYRLKDKISAPESTPKERTSPEEGLVSRVSRFWKQHRWTITTLVCWGSIVGVNWTYGSLFRVIFEGHGLSEKQIALLGLAANLSTAFFSNLGTFIHNTWRLSSRKVIGILNLLGFISAFLLSASSSLPFLENVYLMMALVVVLRAGFSSFVSLGLMELEASGIPSVIISGMFFWVANVVNLLTTELVDLVEVELSVSLITLAVALCIHFAAESHVWAAIPCDR